MATKTVKKIKLDSKKTTKKAVATEPTKKSTKKISGAKAARVAASPATGLVRYIKGSWYELRQVRWPNRRATWGMTLAVIGFTLFFSVVILLLDGAFQWLFKEVLLK